MLDWKTYKTQLLKDKELKEAYDALELEYQVARSVIQARLARNLTQKDLAEKLGTKQSVISRLEGGNSLPSLSFLRRVTKVLGAEITINLKP